MQSLSSREAADRLGVTVQKFHRLTRTFNLAAVAAVPGIRGAKFWNAADIEALAATLADEAVA